jgi:hypothetical protein
MSLCWLYDVDRLKSLNDVSGKRASCCVAGADADVGGALVSEQRCGGDSHWYRGPLRRGKRCCVNGEMLVRGERCGAEQCGGSLSKQGLQQSWR